MRLNAATLALYMVGCEKADRRGGPKSRRALPVTSITAILSEMITIPLKNTAAGLSKIIEDSIGRYHHKWGIISTKLSNNFSYHAKNARDLVLLSFDKRLSKWLLDFDSS